MQTLYHGIPAEKVFHIILCFHEEKIMEENEMYGLL